MIDTFYLKDEKNLSYKNECESKKIFVYTPASYKKESNKCYPVIYAFDGQNLFEESCGEYKCEAKSSVGLDKIFEKANKDVVIVGIYNGEGEFTRDRELTMCSDFGTLCDPTGSEGFKEGTLDKTGAFIVETLIPFIQSNYKVSTNKEDTTIFGASSGGLASFYLGLKYPDVFGNVYSLSLATCLFYKKDWEKFFNKVKFSVSQKMFVYCGKESDDWLENYLYNGLGDSDLLSASEIKPFLEEHGYIGSNINCLFESGAVHNEDAWNLAVKKSIVK